MPAQLRMAAQDHGTKGTDTGHRLRGENHFSRLAVLDDLSAAELREIEAVGTAILAANPESEDHEIDPDVAAIYYGDPADRPEIQDEDDFDEGPHGTLFATIEPGASLCDMYDCPPWSEAFVIVPRVDLTNTGSVRTRRYA